MDTNVFAAALRSQLGASYKLLSLVGTTAKFQINVSIPLVLEYEEIAKRQKSDTGLTDHDVEDIIDYLCSVANRHPIYFLWRPFLKDSKDDMVLELAIKAQCDSIVTFNRKDFAGVEEHFGIKVISPGAFLRQIGSLP